MRAMGMVAVLVLAGCMKNSTPDLAAYDSDLAAVRQQVTSYESAVTVAPAGTNCAADRDHYLGELRPVLSRMRSMSIGFDGCMGMMQQRESSGFQMMCTELDGELDRYESVGCGASDPATNRRTALDHCTLMMQLLDQASAQSGTMRSAMGGSPMHGCR